MGDCIDGKEHGAILTADDDPEVFDPSVLHPEVWGPRPNGYQWGYCGDCRTPFRWSVGDQRWRPWPGGLGQLPALTDEELDLLHDAVAKRMMELGGIGSVAHSKGMQAEVAYRLVRLNALDTAIQETRYHLWPPDGDYAPRAWGEAWGVLEAWVTHEQESAANSNVAYGTLDAVLAKIAELRAPAPR